MIAEKIAQTWPQRAWKAEPYPEYRGNEAVRACFRVWFSQHPDPVYSDFLLMERRHRAFVRLYPATMSQINDFEGWQRVIDRVAAIERHDKECKRC